MKVLVTGAAGMLGREMVAEFHRRGFDVTAMDHAGLDITDLEKVRRVVGESMPQVVVNCAAYTDVDKAESEPDKAYLVNGLGPRNLALACAETGASLVQISTDYVFDGQHNRPLGVYDSPCPVNVYGASKLWGERAVLGLLKASYIIRTSWLFGPGGKNFVSKMLELAGLGKPIKVVADQFGCPTFTEDLARVVADLMQTRCYGIYHVTNQNPTTWFKFAETIFTTCRYTVELIPCSTREFKSDARRPGFTVLHPFPLQETIGYLPPPWEDALKRYLAKLGGMVDEDAGNRRGGVYWN